MNIGLWLKVILLLGVTIMFYYFGFIHKDTHYMCLCGFVIAWNHDFKGRDK